MSNSGGIEAATRRLQQALAALETAVEGRIDEDRGHGALVEQVHAFDDDRARLAAELDATAARARQLETVNRDIARRLDVAINTIRTVIAPQDE